MKISLKFSKISANDKIFSNEVKNYFGIKFEESESAVEALLTQLLLA